MKEYKRTYCASLPCIYLELFIICIPGALVADFILSFLDKSTLGTIFVSFVAVSLLFVAFALIFMALINLIINSFKQPSVFVDEKFIRHMGTTLELDRVEYITLHLPEMHTRYSYSSQELSIYINDNEDILIKRPSVRLIADLKSRCGQAKFGINDLKSRLKKDVIISLCITAVVAVMALV